MSAAEILKLLEKQPIFAGLERRVLEELAAQGSFQNLPVGQSACEEGGVGDAAFLIYSGRLRVIKAGPDGHSLTLATLTRGDIFGERAVLAGEPRNATVRAEEDTTLVRFDRQTFLVFVRDHPELQAYFQALVDERGIATFLRSSTVLRAVSPAQLRELVVRLRRITFAAGDRIIREGDPGDRLYVLGRGEAKALKTAEDGEKTLAFYGPGEHFGERALITGEPRAATVIALQDSLCLALNKADFDAVLESTPKLREALEQQIADQTVDPESAARYSPKAESTAQRRSPDYRPAGEAAAEAEPILKPKRGVFRRYPWIRQYDETDCGAASLAMISRHFGKRLSLARLRDLANVDREGASMFNLAAAAESIGYSSRAVKGNYAALLTLDLPAIAHWKGYHYIVVYEADEKRVLVADPAIGVFRMDREDFEKGWTGRLLLLQPTQALLSQEEQETTVKRFLPLLRPYHTLLIEVLLASLLINIFGLATPFFTQTIIDKVLVHQDVQMLNIMLGGMLIIGVFSTLAVLLRRYLLIHVSQKLSLRLASDLFRQIMRLPLSYFGKRKVGDILTRFADNRKVQELITSSAINTLLDLLMVVVYLAVMFFYNAELTAVALIFIPASILLTVGFTPAMKRNNQQLFEKIAVAQSKLIESIEKVGAIKTSTAEMTTRWRYEDLIVQRANQAFHGAKLGMVMGAFSSAIQLLSSTVILWYGAHLVINAEMSVGQLIAFNTLIGMVMAPILGLVGMWQRLQDAFLSLQRLSDIYDAEPEETEGAEQSLVQLPPLQGNITFEAVSFRYGADSPNVIADIDLEIQAGQRVAVVGRSGSGKTTLITLLQRLQRLSEGRILIDGYDIAAVSGRSLRSQLGAVMQDSSIFTGTIRENIALSQPDAPIERVVAAARLANAHDFITAFPLGYDTVIGEIGIGLSGGQRQRVCIARALLNEPRIILFDEATSALDTESERAIQENMDTMLTGRTALIVAHRLSTIRSADIIVVLDEGRIVEKGSHADLLAERGLYHYLHSQQLGE